MEENLKYYKLTAGDINASIVIACREDQVADMMSKYKGYTLVECEKPEGAQIIQAEPNVKPVDPMMMHDYMMLDPWQNVRHTVYDSPKCSRCANRCRRNRWCDSNYKSTQNCYRFKLDQ